MHPVFQWSLIVLRVAFGTLFVFSGLNDFFHFWQPPAPTTPQSQIFMQGLQGSGYLIPLQGAVYTLSGLALIANRFVPLALVVLAAPTAVIVGYHAVMECHPLGPSLIVLATHLLLAWQQRKTLSVLFQPRPSV
ncbi:DoxX protein [Dyella sp. OK004]|uniref:DoxX family membrane protein n=1 Tax=Dyella sp. OK004 TaxID=1855292 RepID=UPI0008E04713|nr:DoxX family membrane protein [Dyella sp. OK004]SFS04621.1 DoxX protein [Dyella sp. OK004]